MIYGIDDLVKLTGRNATAVLQTDRDPWFVGRWGWNDKRGPVLDGKALPEFKEALARVPGNVGRKRTKVRRVHAHAIFQKAIARMG